MQGIWDRFQGAGSKRSISSAGGGVAEGHGEGRVLAMDDWKDRHEMGIGHNMAEWTEQ